MNTSQIKKLRSRWGQEELALGERALAGKGDSPFGRTPDGHSDLRGLTVRAFVKGVSIRRMDLSGMIFEGFGQFGNCSIEESIFNGALLQTNLGAKFNSCDFVSADLAGATLRGKFNDCRFTAAKLAAATGTQVEFSRCDFSKANIRKALLTHCKFDECKFQDSQFGSGSFAFSTFIRSPLDGGLLNNTMMDRVVQS